MKRRLLDIVLCLALAFGCCAGVCEQAFASEEEATSSVAADSAEQLGLMPKLYRLVGKTTTAEDGSTVEGVGALFPNLLKVATTPEYISTGVACSMEDLCGIDPCTCGKPDAWGHCACGGYEETAPTVVVASSDETVLRVVEAFGRVWLVPCGAGVATVSVEASLVHYEPAAYSFEVSVGAFGLADLLLLVAAFLLVAGLVALAVLLVRLGVRGARRLTRWVAARKARARGLRRLRVRDPFLHDFLFCLRQALPAFLGGLVLFFVLVPLSTSVVSDISIFNVDYTHEQLKYQLFAQDLAPVVNAACVLFGVVLALVLFRFVLEKRSTTAFFSLGLSRVRLFAARYLAGVLCLVAGIGLPFAVSLLLNHLALGLYDGQVYEFFYVLAGYLTVALVAFALAALACVCAGTLFEACAFVAALLLGATVVLWGLGLLAQFLLVGCAAGASMYGQDATVLPAFLDSLAWLNPVLFFAEEGAAHQFFMALHPVYYPELASFALVAAWFVVALALAATACAALVARRGEQAEMAGKQPVLALASVAVFGLAAFAAAVYVLGQVDLTTALVVAVALFLLVSLVLLFGPFRGRTSRRVTLACVGGEVAAMCAVVGLLYGGAFGFASAVPAADEVASVQVSYVGSPSYLAGEFAATSSGASYYCTSTRTYTNESSIELVRAVHSELVATARAEQATNYMDFESSVVPYDVVLRYTLADGSEVVRYYSQASIGELVQLLALDNDEGTTALETAVLTGDASGLSEEDAEALSNSAAYNAYRTGSVYAADGALNRILSVELTDAERAELLAALAADLAALPASERYFPTSAARVVLMFTSSPELDVSSFSYSFSNAVSYVTDEWEATMAWLEGHGYCDALDMEIDAAIIESLTFQLDDPYSSINKVTSPVSRYFMGYRSETAAQFWITQDYGALTVVEDSAKIAEILPSLRLGCFMSGGYLVQAKLSGIEAYVYFYLPADSAPSEW